MTQPLFSLITPVLNAGGTLADTIASVREQDFTDYEWIVQDGGSTDGCMNLWEGLPQVKLETAPDSGLYDAMNKAVARSNGKWLVFLQADDWLEPGALAAFAQAARTSAEFMVLAGGSSAVNFFGGQWKTEWEKNSPDVKRLDFSAIALGEPMLNARAYRRELWTQLGGFNTRWSLAADRAWLLKLSRLNPTVAAVGQKVYRYRWHEGSKTMNAGNALSKRLMLENLEIAEALQESCSELENSVLKSWHTREAVRLAMNQLEDFEISLLLCTLVSGTKMNPLMSIFFLWEIFRCLPGLLARGGKTKTALRRASVKKGKAFCAE